MSYDISFRVKVEGLPNKWIKAFDCDANITYNVRKIITESTGLEWRNEENNGLCSEVIPYIEKGLIELQKNREKYLPFESPNGWGTVDGVIRFFKWIIQSWNYAVMEDPELAAITTFWIM